MDPKNSKKHCDFMEAETISNDDSEKSSLLEFSYDKNKEVHQAEGFMNLKKLVESLEGSIYLSNTIDNSLLIKCALLEAENQNLKRCIRDKNLKLNHILCKSQLKVAQTSGKDKTRENEETGKYRKKTAVHRSLSSNDGMKSHLSNEKLQIEMNKLKETIADLEGELKEREETIKLLCDKYMYLKSNKVRMEIKMKKKIYQLEKLLKVMHGILQEVQTDVETKIENYLSKAKNVYEVLFLQEKWRCNRLMHENVRLHHVIKRLEEGEEKN